MTNLFSPKMPDVVTPEEPAPPPERSDAKTQSLAATQRAQFFARGGRSETDKGAQQPVSSVARFLGGVGSNV